MGTPRFTPEFKEEAVRQITERGYSVAEVSRKPGAIQEAISYSHQSIAGICYDFIRLLDK
jgi:transposase-like protein